MVDGKAVNRKSVVDKNGTKGTRLSLVTAKVPIKRTESDVDAEGDEGDDEDVSAKISPIGAPLAARRNFAASLINPASMDFNGGGNSNKSSPLVRYSHIYPSKSQQQFDIETQVDDEASGVDQTGPSPGSQGTSSAPGTGPVSPAVAVAALLPPRKPAPPAPPGGGGPAPAAYGKPEENPSYSKAEGNGAYSKASATAPVPPPPTPPAPPAVYKPQSDGLSLAANKPAPSSSSVVPPPPPPPPGSKTASPPPPPVNSDDRNVNKMIATGLIPPPPTAQQLQESAVVAAGTADSDSDAEEGEEEEEENGGSAREESPAVPVPMQVAASSKGNYLDDMLSRSGSLKLTGSFFGGGGSAGQSAPPPPPPPPLPARVRTASTDANAVAGPGVASPVRILLKPRPTSSNTDASVSVTPRAARLSTSARTASTDSVSSQLSGYPFLAAGAGVAGVSAMLSGLTVAADEHEAEIDHFAAVNSAESSFNKNVSELMV